MLARVMIRLLRVSKLGASKSCKDEQAHFPDQLNGDDNVDEEKIQIFYGSFVADIYLKSIS
jgi:hypothetical protein